MREYQPGIASFEPPPDTVLVVSDLHIGVGQDPVTLKYEPRENFFADTAFRNLLEQHDPARCGSSLLVLNGDIWDFLRVPEIPETEAELLAWQSALADLGVPKELAELRTRAKREIRYGLRTDDYKSVWKLLRIARGHPEFFQALGWWIRQGGSLVIVKGNHDVELFWPIVQRAVRSLVAGGGDPQPVEERLHFVQAGFVVGNLYVEHGNQFEGVTSVEGEPTLPGGTELNIPLGSCVNRYVINQLEGLEPFLDNTKPLNKLLWSMFREHPIIMTGIAVRSLPFLQRAVRRYRFRYTVGFLIYFGSLLVPLLTLIVVLVALLNARFFGIGWIQHLVSRFSGTTRIVMSVGGILAPYLAGLLKDAKDFIKGWFRKRSVEIGEDAYGKGIFARLARVGFPASFTRVYGALGHTHQPDLQVLPALGSALELYYLNSGTWAPLWDEARPDLLGRIKYSLLRFRLQPGGEYRHECLEWCPDRAAVIPATILAREGLRRRSFAFLTAREQQTVTAFAEVFIEGSEEAIPPEDITLNIDAMLRRIRSKRTRSLKLALLAIEYVLPLLIFRRRFSRLDLEQRRRLIDSRLARSKAGSLLRSLAKLRVLFLAGYYGDARAHPSLGFVEVAKRPRNLAKPLLPLGRPVLQVRLPDYGESVVTADLCVIGSGAGGAVIAYHAAQAGREVVLLEEGRYIRTPELSHDEGRMSTLLYKEGGLQTTVDLGMSILQGRALGGTTFINNAICFRLDDEDLHAERRGRVLRQWAKLGARIDAAALGESYGRVSKMIDVQRIDPLIVGGNGQILLDGWIALVAQGRADPAFPSNRFRKNFDRCGACGYCNWACPYERKLSMLETYVARAIDHGARVIPECHAVRIETAGGKATEVRCVLADGRELRVRARQVVVACGTIGSSVLLMKSGIGRNVGARFSCNIASPALARFPQQVNGFDGDQMATFVDTGRFMLETSFNPPVPFAAALPGWFETHFDRMRDLPHLASAGAVVGTESNGRVKRSALFRDLLGPVGYRMTPGDLALLREGLSLLSAVYFAGGAESVYLSTFFDDELKQRDFAPGGNVDLTRIQAEIARIVTRPEDLTLSTAHPQGGNPMSDDPKVGVVDSKFRVHGVANLFVSDASVFPSSLGINPQLTIMAMADYAWHQSIANGGRA